jgi:hypothetical protein
VLQQANPKQRETRNTDCDDDDLMMMITDAHTATKQNLQTASEKELEVRWSVVVVCCEKGDVVSSSNLRHLMWCVTSFLQKFKVQ